LIKGCSFFLWDFELRHEFLDALVVLELSLIRSLEHVVVPELFGLFVGGYDPDARLGPVFYPVSWDFLVPLDYSSVL